MPLNGRAIYEALGRDDLAAQYRRRNATQWWLAGGGFVTALAGVVAGPMFFVAASEQCRTWSGSRLGVDSECARQYRILGISSLAIGLAGFVAFGVGLRIKPHPIEAHELNVLIEDYNLELLRELELRESDLPAEEEGNWREHLRVDAFFTGDSGGVLGSGIKTFPRGVLKLHNLREFTFLGSLEEPMPAELGQLDALELLEIHNWRFKVLPEEFCHLKKLHTLQLVGCALEELPSCFGALTALTSLSLAYNNLQTLPDTLGELQALKKLDLSSNQLTALPDTLADLKNLTHLYASDCKLTTLPESILIKNNNLRHLDLSNNVFCASARETLNTQAQRLGDDFRPPIFR